MKPFKYLLIAILSSLWGNEAQANSAEQFESMLDTHTAPLIRNYINYGIDNNSAVIVARYLILKGFVIIENKFNQLGCDSIFDHKRKRKLYRKAFAQAFPFIENYLSYYQNQVILAGFDIAKLENMSEQNFGGNFSCD